MSLNRNRMAHAKHTPSGIGALIQECEPPEEYWVVAQFDDINHPHGHGWTRYPRDQFVKDVLDENERES